MTLADELAGRAPVVHLTGERRIHLAQCPTIGGRPAHAKPTRGQRKGDTFVSDEQVDDMRALYAFWRARKDRRGYGALAKLFGCSPSTARDIVKCRTRS